MPQQGLHAAEVGSIIQKVRCKAVAEFVRREIGWQAGLGEAELEEGVDGTRREAAAGFVDEEWTRMHAGGVAVALDRFEGGSTDRTHPFAGTFASDACRLADRIDITHIQADEFRESHSGRVEKLDHRCVARRHPRRRLFVFLGGSGSRNQIVHLRGREKSRQLFLGFGKRDFEEHIF